MWGALWRVFSLVWLVTDLLHFSVRMRSSPTSWAEACNTDICLAWPKRCPGSSKALLGDPNPLLLPAVECSDNGDCVREAGSNGVCRDGEACSAVCVCHTNYTGSDCSLTAAEMAAAQATRALYLTSLVRVQAHT